MGHQSHALLHAGTSTYVFNADSGRIYRHIDVWDSINNQKFFSFEARHVHKHMFLILVHNVYMIQYLPVLVVQGFLDFLQQLFQTPAETPTECTLLK